MHRITPFILALLIGCGSTPDDGPVSSDTPDASDTGADTVRDAPPPGDADGVDTPQEPDTAGPDIPLPSDDDPGRVTLHRLNRTEYNNTLRDLLGTTQRPADDFPLDDSGFGFDNNADVLSVSPAFVEQHERAVNAVLDEVLAIDYVESRSATYSAFQIGADEGHPLDRAYWFLPSGQFEFTHRFSHAGTYVLRSRLSAEIDFFQPVIVSVQVEGEARDVHEIWTEYPEFGLFETEVTVPAGDLQVAYVFTNPNFQDGDHRYLILDEIEVEGPVGLPGPARESRAALLPCAPEADDCIETVLRRFTYRAWRRPSSEEELGTLVSLVQGAMEAGDSAEDAVRLGLKATLMSPWFLYRVELDPDPRSNEPHPLTDYELAARLSYFLWSSTPDEALLDLADRRALGDPETLRAQVRRMLADPKASALLDNFAGQWLAVRRLDEVDPSPSVYPDFDDELRAGFRDETRAFFWELLHGDAPLTELLTADHTYVNERLAEHYGIEGPSGDELVRVEDSGRGGILTHGSFLTTTSHADRTSAVRRGKWVLGQLLCDEPPAPPPGVEDLPTREQVGGTLRDRMEAHIVLDECRGCHASMDPIGFALEHYDGIGRWRDDEDGLAIDATGTLPGGASFDGAYELARVLAADDRFTSCVTRQMTTYALGRGVERWDAADLQSIEIQWRRAGLRLRDLIELVVLSDAFTQRRGEP